jgi:uncharacterized protein
MNRQRQNNIDFRWRFIWRLIILLFFGFVHSLLYRSDILQVYALLGMVLVLVERLSTNWVMVLTVL